MAEESFESVLETYGFLCWPNVGISMMPLLRQGRDGMIIESKDRRMPRKYDAVLFRRPGTDGRGAYVLHRILKCSPDGSYWIVGDNCVTGETVSEENILGVLTAVQRGKRRISADSLGYKLYVYLWCAPYPLRFFFLKIKGKIFAVGHRVKVRLKALSDK